MQPLRVKPSQVAGFSEAPSAKPSLNNVTLSSRDQKCPIAISGHLQAWDSPASDSYPALLLIKKLSKQQITLFQKWHFYKYPRQMLHLFCSSAAVQPSYVSGQKCQLQKFPMALQGQHPLDISPYLTVYMDLAFGLGFNSGKLRKEVWTVLLHSAHSFVLKGPKWPPEKYQGTGRSR